MGDSDDGRIRDRANSRENDAVLGSGSSSVPPRHRSHHRRRVLAAVGLTVGATLGGCLGDDVGGEPTYEGDDVVDVDGDARTPEELTAAEAVAEQEIREGVTPLDGLSIAEHAFVLEDGYQGSTIQGIVENDEDGRLDLVEVRVRVYDDDGAQLGRYLDRTGDLDSGGTWAFTVIVLEPPVAVAAYDISVLGTPA